MQVIQTKSKYNTIKKTYLFYSSCLFIKLDALQAKFNSGYLHNDRNFFSFNNVVNGVGILKKRTSFILSIKEVQFFL